MASTQTLHIQEIAVFTITVLQMGMDGTLSNVIVMRALLLTTYLKYVSGLAWYQAAKQLR